MAGAEITVMLDFNPRPREGGDMSRPALSSGISYFNPRPREGGDREIGPPEVFKIISIHAPARGATGARHCFYAVRDKAFQSTPPRGGRRRKSIP